MDSTRDIDVVKDQEAKLVFGTFSEADAFDLGSRVREKALADDLGLVVDIRTWDRPLFYCATPGSTGSNPEWARRKSNLVRRFKKASYRMVLELARPDKTFPQAWGIDQADYALAGGGFPITVIDVGVIGSIAVSGLPEREDHNLVARSISQHLGISICELESK